LRIDEYVRMRSRNLSERTLRSHESVLRNFERLAEVSGEPGPEDVQRYIDACADRYEDSSLQQNLRVVKAYWETMGLPGKERLEEIIETRGPSVSLSSHRRTVYSKGEVKRIIAGADWPWSLFYALAYTYARRLKEVASLRTSDVDEETIGWRITKKSGSRKRFLSRSLLPDAWDDWLERRLGEVSERLFPECWDGDRFKYWVPQNKMRATCERAGINKTSVHGLRHSRARHLLDDGMDPRTLKDGLLFHELLSTTTDIYGTKRGAEEEIPGVEL